jgi:hypothetical protein
LWVEHVFSTALHVGVEFYQRDFTLGIIFAMVGASDLAEGGNENVKMVPNVKSLW